LKANEIIHQEWCFCFLKVKFGMLIETVKNNRFDKLVLKRKS
jgi:hypothetical protein